MARDGSILWLDPSNPRDDRGRPVRLDPHLYGGTVGIAFFLAALTHTLAETELRSLALKALDPLRQQLRNLFEQPARADAIRFSLGGTVGLGAYIYGFLRIGQWLDEVELIEEARRVATLITPKQIADDASLDVMHGSAGAVLGLLALHRSAPEALAGHPSPLEIAFACGRHLLEHRTGRPPAWSVKGRKPWCGFGHGAAGIACALLRLYGQTGYEEFRQAAREAFDFERLHFDPAARNWRDLRSLEPRFMTAWCQGAPGIALARLGGLDWIEDPRIEAEIQIGLETTRTAADLERDFLCCGNMGRVEILLYAHQKLDQEALRRHAEDLADRVVASAHRSQGHYQWFSSVPDHRFSPALFTGAAGVGYALLRLYDPSLPCILLLE